MNIRAARILGAIIFSLEVLCGRPAMADNVLHRLKLAPLSPELRDLAAAEFPKDELLRDVLVPSDLEMSPDHLPELVGGTFPANRKGDVGAIIVVDSPLWCGTIGCDARFFLKRDGRWRLVGDSLVGTGLNYVVNVLPTTDHGFYRLDLNWRVGCPGDAKRHTAGIMVWKGTKYDDLHPCPPYDRF
jgi:hypothetical protein